MPARLLSFLPALAALVTVTAAHAESKIQQCGPGPWGTIEYQTIYLEAPEWIITQFPLPSVQPRWCFPTSKREDLHRFLLQAGIEKEMAERWLNSPRCQVIDGYLTIFPSPADVEAMPGPARSIINPELAKLPVNEFFNQPIYITANSVDEWLHGSSLPPKVVELIKKLAYLEGDALLFSNVSTLLSHAESETEARQWLKEITRTKALLAYLRIGPDEDVKAVADYWSSGWRRKDVLPLLESVAETASNNRLDLTHLLPSQPRKLIYTYPSTDAALFGQTPNCHWTSLNFFNYFPQNIYLDLKLAATGVLSNYSPVSKADTFGDVLFFLDAEGNAFHSCVYIADNLVYTKNGDNPVAPWILTTLEEVKQIYLRKAGAKISAFRRGEGRQSAALPRQVTRPTSRRAVR
jgi:hypothetical protein